VQFAHLLVDLPSWQAGGRGRSWIASSAPRC